MTCQTMWFWRTCGRRWAATLLIREPLRQKCTTGGSFWGPILADEVNGLVSAVKAVYGVRQVENKLDVHQTAENVSALQGGMCALGESSDWIQQNWSPTTRFIAGALGGVAMLNCLTKRTLPAMVAGTGGLLLLVRALSNQELIGALEGDAGTARAALVHQKARGSSRKCRLDPMRRRVQAIDARSARTAAMEERRRTIGWSMKHRRSRFQLVMRSASHDGRA